MDKKNFRKKIENLLSDENGSSMVEFSLVLPMLVVLTVGGVYLSVSFSQKAVMNGLAFQQVRAGSVRADYKDIAGEVRKYYLKNADKKQKWLEKTKTDADVIVHTDKTTDLRMVLSMDALNSDILANSLSILAGTKPDNRIRKISSYVILPAEYTVHTSPGGYVSDRSKTATVVDYETRAFGMNFIEHFLLGSLQAFPSVREWVKEQIMPVMVDPKTDNDTGGGTNDQTINDQVVSADAGRNMKRVNGVYEYWGLKHPPNKPELGDDHSVIHFEYSEEPNDKYSLDSLHFLKFTGEHIGKIETATDIIALANNLTVGLTPYGQAIEKIKVIVGRIGDIAEKSLTKFAEGTENNNNIMFTNDRGLTQ